MNSENVSFIDNLQNSLWKSFGFLNKYFRSDKCCLLSNIEKESKIHFEYLNQTCISKYLEQTIPYSNDWFDTDLDKNISESIGEIINENSKIPHANDWFDTDLDKNFS